MIPLVLASFPNSKDVSISIVEHSIITASLEILSIMPFLSLITNPEGFVAVTLDDGAVKLVDRLEFSRQNFLAPKTFGSR